MTENLKKQVKRVQEVLLFMTVTSLPLLWNACAPMVSQNGVSTTSLSSSTSIPTPEVGLKDSTGTLITTLDSGTPPSIPNKALWLSRMKGTEASSSCSETQVRAALFTSTGAPKDGGNGLDFGSVWYYDGSRVYAQIYNETGDPKWRDCSDMVANLYREWIFKLTTMDNGQTINWPIGKLNGYSIFPHGLAMHHRRTGDPLSKEAVRRLTVFSAGAESGGDTDSAAMRETAYILNANIENEKLGQDRRPQFDLAVDFALGHLQKTFVDLTDSRISAFMVGLNFEALINAYQLTGDSRIPVAIAVAADRLYKWFYIVQDKNFMYASCSDSSLPRYLGMPTAAIRYLYLCWDGSGIKPTTDEQVNAKDTGELTSLIAPVYAWLWQYTGNAYWREIGDRTFSDAISTAQFWSGKQFSQTYKWTFDYIKWRSAPPKSLPLKP